MVTAPKPGTTGKAAPSANPALTAPSTPITTIEIPTKARQLTILLRSDGGASIAELAKLLSWLPHTTRAALTGLRKKGHAIVKSKDGDVTRYRIVSPDADV
jgi:hypothetical protein